MDNNNFFISPGRPEDFKDYFQLNGGVLDGH